MRRWNRVLAAIALTGILALCFAAPAGALHSGDTAPEFALPATTADKISLGQYLGRKHVVIFFYIAAFGRS
jgi:hypothetical protein